MSSQESIVEFLGHPVTEFDCGVTTVRITDDVDTVIFDVTVKAEKEEVVEIPRYAAEKLVSVGGGIIKEDDMVLILKQSLQKERMQSELVGLDDLFYRRLASQLRMGGDEGGKYHSLLNEFVRGRIGKILQISGHVTKENQKRMTVEERLFVEKIGSALQEYVGSVTNVQ